MLFTLGIAARSTLQIFSSDTRLVDTDMPQQKKLTECNFVQGRCSVQIDLRFFFNPIKHTTANTQQLQLQLHYLPQSYITENEVSLADKSSKARKVKGNDKIRP